MSDVFNRFGLVSAKFQGIDQTRGWIWHNSVGSTNSALGGIFGALMGEISDGDGFGKIYDGIDQIWLRLEEIQDALIRGRNWPLSVCVCVCLTKFGCARPNLISRYICFPDPSCARQVRHFSKTAPGHDGSTV